MREFKVGEEVVLVGHYHSNNEGDTWIVSREYKENKGVAILNNRGCKLRVPFKHVKHKYPNPPHKHMKEIIEWAKGADIGFIEYGGDIQPCVDNTPSWDDFNKYKVIEPTPPKSERELKIEELEAKAADIAKQIEELK